MSVVTVVVILSYLYVAMSLFEEDKKAYVYDTNQQIASSTGDQAKFYLNNLIKTIRLGAAQVKAGSKQRKNLEEVDQTLELEEEILDFLAYDMYPNKAGQKSRIAYYYGNRDFIKQNELQRNFFSKLRKKHQPPLDSVLLKKTIVNSIQGDYKVPLLLINIAYRFKDSSGHRVVSALIHSKKLIKISQNQSLAAVDFIDSKGNRLVSSSRNEVGGGFTPQSQNFKSLSKRIFESKNAGGTFSELDSSQKDWLLSYSKIPNFDLAVISSIPKEKAFIALEILFEKSVYFAVLILGFSILISIWFSKKLTSPLKKLYQATRKVAEGEFQFKTEIKTGDEIGALSDSFNVMTSEIERLMEDTAGKARMEKELETARIVQENLFPETKFQVGNLDIASFYTPASECGGDWWGTIKLSKNKIAILLGDATGHGVPAALITAAAQSCATTIQKTHRNMGAEKVSASFILENLNNAIFNAGKGRIKMTFFVCIIDSITGEIEYANASHEFPIISRTHVDENGQQRRSRKDLDSLTGDPGLALGDKEDTAYENHSSQLNMDDVLFIYTDGLTEGQSPEGEEYTEKRLLRSLVKSGDENSADIVQHVDKKAHEFFDGVQQEDDITYVVIKRRQSKEEEALQDLPLAS
jgi:sigma-B regulation protein RsbU (phosphoserine phosphatase)